MIIEGTHSGTVIAFEPCRIQGERYTKVGFICEAEKNVDARIGVVELVAKHCTVTGDHPANLLTRVEIK